MGKKVYLCGMKVPIIPLLCRDITLPDEVGWGIRFCVSDVYPLLADEVLQDEWLQRLSATRRAKVEACAHPRSRCLSMGVALALDGLLQDLGLRERDMSYVENEHGKPLFVEHPEIAFNLSHSGRLVAAAIAPSHVRIGIDLQRIGRYRPELVRRVFSVRDREALASARNEADRERLFTQLWCRAEAYAKATGDGLQWPFPEPPAEARFFDFDVDKSTPESFPTGEPSSPADGAGYCVSLCVLSP